MIYTSNYFILDHKLRYIYNEKEAYNDLEFI